MSRPDWDSYWFQIAATMYGGVLMFRGWCRDCRKNAFVQNGLLVCCGTYYTAKRITQARIATKTGSWRERSNEAERDALVEAQQGLCFYCVRPFWSVVYQKHKTIVLRPNVDHFVPFVHCQSSSVANKVAACHICNSLKGALVFMDTDIAREYLRERWIKKGYRDDVDGGHAREGASA